MRIKLFGKESCKACKKKINELSKEGHEVIFADINKDFEALAEFTLLDNRRGPDLGTVPFLYNLDYQPEHI